MTIKKGKKVSASHLEMFYTLVSSGNFTMAGKHLGISKAAVSNTIKILEKELEVTLINRTTRTMSLTDEGTLLYDQCEQLHQKITEIKEITDSFHDKPSGILRISSSSFFAHKALPQIIKSYQEKFPLVDIEVNIEERIYDFKEDSLDLIFGVSWTPPDNLVARKIISTKYVLCASKTYINKNGKPKSINELASHKHVTHKGRTAAIVCLNESIFETPIDNTLLSNNAAFIKECILNGLGIGQLHEYLIRDEIKNGELISLLEDVFKKEIGIYMYYQKDKFVKPKVKEFVKIAMEVCKKINF